LDRALVEPARDILNVILQQDFNEALVIEARDFGLEQPERFIVQAMYAGALNIMRQGTNPENSEQRAALMLRDIEGAVFERVTQEDTLETAEEAAATEQPISQTAFVFAAFGEAERREQSARGIQHTGIRQRRRSRAAHITLWEYIEPVMAAHDSEQAHS